jgi:phage terminase large subunit
VERVEKKRKIIATFEPLSWQEKAWVDISPVVLLTGSAGGGKSELAAQKIHGFCKRYKNSTGLMVRKTRESMTSSTVLFMERHVIGSDPEVNHFPSKHRFEYTNGSVLLYGGMKNEEQREQIRSIGLAGGVDIAWMEEANRFIRQDFEEVIARMRGRAAPWTQVILSTNPDSFDHWINSDLIIGKGASVHYSSAQENPHNPESYLRALNSLTGIMAERLREGKWVRAEGVVYEEFDNSIHILNKEDGVWTNKYFTIQPGKIRSYIGGQDWGFTNPGVLGVWGIDGDGRLYLIRESYYSRQRIGWWVAKGQKYRDLYRMNPIVCDPSEPGHIDEYRKNNLSVIKGINSISLGIQKVKERLAVQGDGMPRLFILSDALEEVDPNISSGSPFCTLGEFGSYIYPKGGDGKPIKETPVDDNNHGMDMMRYSVMYVDEGFIGNLEVLTVPREEVNQSILIGAAQRDGYSRTLEGHSVYPSSDWYKGDYEG